MQRNTHTNTRTRKTSRTRAIALQRIETRIVIALFCAVLCSIGLYIYFVSATIVHAVIAKDAQQEIMNAHSRIAELEVAYLSQKDTITPSLAHELGFIDVTAKHFVERSRYLGRADARATQ